MLIYTHHLKKREEVQTIRNIKNTTPPETLRADANTLASQIIATLHRPDDSDFVSQFEQQVELYWQDGALRQRQTLKQLRRR